MASLACFEDANERQNAWIPQIVGHDSCSLFQLRELKLPRSFSCADPDASPSGFLVGARGVREGVGESVNNFNVPIEVMVFIFYSDEITIDVKTGLVTRHKN